MGYEFEVRCLRYNGKHTPGAKAPLFTVPQSAKAEALAYLEANVGCWLDHEA
jgi:hypothetical protein